jgi:hypothetical protein
MPLYVIECGRALASPAGDAQPLLPKGRLRGFFLKTNIF